MSRGSLFLTVLLLSSPFLVSVTRIIFRAFFYRVIPCGVLRQVAVAVGRCSRHEVVQRGNRADLSRCSSYREEWYCRCGVGQIPIQIRGSQRQVSSAVMANKHRRRYRRRSSAQRCSSLPGVVDYGRSRLYTNMQANRKLRSVAEGVRRRK